MQDDDNKTLPKENFEGCKTGVNKKGLLTKNKMENFVCGLFDKLQKAKHKVVCGVTRSRQTRFGHLKRKEKNIFSKISKIFKDFGGLW